VRQNRDIKGRFCSPQRPLVLLKADEATTSRRAVPECPATGGIFVREIRHFATVKFKYYQFYLACSVAQDKNGREVFLDLTLQANTTYEVTYTHRQTSTTIAAL